TAYDPGVRNGMLKRPSESEIAVFAPCGPVAVTVTPGTARPWASTMRPLRVPVVSCAIAGIAARINATAAVNASFTALRIARMSSLTFISSRPPGELITCSHLMTPHRKLVCSRPRRTPSGFERRAGNEKLEPTFEDHNAAYICQSLLLS